MAELRSKTARTLERRYNLFMKGASKALARANLDGALTGKFMQGLGAMSATSEAMLQAIDLPINEQEIRAQAAAKARTPAETPKPGGKDSGGKAPGSPAGAPGKAG